MIFFVLIFLIYDLSYAQKYVKLPLLEVRNNFFCNSIHNIILHSKYFKDNYGYNAYLNVFFEPEKDSLTLNSYKVSIIIKDRKEQILDKPKGYFVISGMNALVYGHYPAYLFKRLGRSGYFKNYNYITSFDNLHVWVFKYINNRMMFMYIDDF